MSAETDLEPPAPLKAHLADRLRRLNEEIRNYPQPIARCDAQLAALVDERSKVRAELERLAAMGAQVGSPS